MCTNTNTHTHAVHVSLCYTAIDLFVLSPRCTCKQKSLSWPRVGYLWQQKSLVHLVLHKPFAPMDGFHHWALRPVIDATCSGMDLGYQILEPSCDFLELLGFFFMGEKNTSPKYNRENPRENRIDGPVRFEKMFAFLFFGVYFFLGGKILGIYFWKPFSKWFCNALTEITWEIFP